MERIEVGGAGCGPEPAKTNARSAEFQPPPHPLVPRLIIMTEVGCVLVLELVVVVTAAAAAMVVVEVEVVAFVVVGLCGNA